ncbi:hypothetical protein BDF19DRAFT_438787, partial [Syncephalis fuscata]
MKRCTISYLYVFMTSLLLSPFCFLLVSWRLFAIPLHCFLLLVLLSFSSIVFFFLLGVYRCVCGVKWCMATNVFLNNNCM